MKSIKILGVNIDSLSVDELNNIIKETSSIGAKKIISNVNIHAFNLIESNKWLMEFFNDHSSFVFCDGHGVMLGARLLGARIEEKITYADWFPKFCGFAEANDISIFLLGAKPSIADIAKEKLCSQNTNLKIVGTEHGFFIKDYDSADTARVIAKINECKPNVLLLGFGMPAQEKWLLENWDRIDANVALTGGAAIDYMAGESIRPPKVLTNYGFEWLGRMLYEPSRLWRRYLIGNPKFFFRIFKYLLLV